MAHTPDKKADITKKGHIRHLTREELSELSEKISVWNVFYGLIKKGQFSIGKSYGWFLDFGEYILLNRTKQFRTGPVGVY